MHDLKTGPGLYLVAVHASPSQIGPVSSYPGARQRHQAHARASMSLLLDMKNCYSSKSPALDLCPLFHH
ncbi:uncharacterized protein PgNI_04209 [Pyricularia grisea]|uniref:Uncharacterized protein n=1 Tax=Pyricularia grisea TaxID=148305 RepID=A0A6P8BF13_PYRGI|nr:uncharacterized protein PgNI_04209 [Pyricularia grisea]TLD14438.1 hypothetical protein PgNI_04209 [Pyricularia grisea]